MARPARDGQAPRRRVVRARSHSGITALLIAAMSFGCKSTPQGQAVASLDIEGHKAVSASYLRERIATVKAPKFLGLFFVTWLRYDPFESAVLDRDLERIERIYQRLGYYEARARVARVVARGRFVDIEIVVTEGLPVMVRHIEVTGISDLPPALAQHLQVAIELSEREPFDEQKFEDSSSALAKALHDAGYPYAKVDPHAAVDLGPRTADVTYAVVPGVRAKIASVGFEGYGGLPVSTIRRAFSVEPGDEYSAEALEQGRLAVLALGVFSSAVVEPDLSDPKKTEIPIVVRLAPSRLNGVRAGGGIQIDASRAELHALAGWESRNMLGGFRALTIEERPSVVFFPTAIPNFLAPTHLLWGNRISTQLRQPAFLEGRTDATMRLEYAIYPVLLAPLDPNAQVILGYHEIRGSFGLERRWQSAHILAQASYNLQANYPFAYFGDLNPEVQRILISYVDLRATLDLRDDPIVPRKGFSFSNSFELAGGPFGGSAADIRERPSMTMHIPLGSEVTFATRLLFGFLFPRNYAEDDSLLLSFPEHPPVRDLQIMYFRGFFSGGPDSNRGYGFHDIGPHGLAIYNLADPTQADVICNPSNPNYDQRLCSTATGGLTLWEASMELRYPIAGQFGGVTFVDASDVSASRLDVRLTAPHLSVGLGIRYATPIGPVRIDLGVRVPGAQWFGPTPAGEGPQPKPLVWNFPGAISLGIGEAY